MAGEWQLAEVISPHIKNSVQVIAAKDVPYLPKGNRLQTLNIYLPANSSNTSLIGSSVTSLPPTASTASLPRIQVHIHGGAWRDPNLLAPSIEAAVAHAYTNDGSRHLDAIISLNYTLSPFPTHPTQPYDPVVNNHSDPAREAVHPHHIQDILHAFAFLSAAMGLKDDGYILTGHSAGACLAFQATLNPAASWGMPAEFPEIPRPTALLGMNGLYGLPELVHGLGETHEQLKDVYQDLLQIAFGAESGWTSASPAHIGIETLTKRRNDDRMPKLIMVDESVDDQLVPMNQMVLMKSTLEKVSGLKVVRGKRCTGKHAAPWEEGYMIVQDVDDILALLSST